MFRKTHFLNNFFKAKNFFHTQSFPILDKNQNRQGVLFKITGNGESHAKNKKILYEKLGEIRLTPAQSCVALHLLATVHDASGKIVADPHLLGGIFSPDLTIIPGTGISKVHGNKYIKPPYINEDLARQQLITKQDYESQSVFHSDQGVQASLFSPQDGGMSHFGCARYILFINIGITDIYLNEYIKRLHTEKNSDKTYNRQFNNCTRRCCVNH